MTFSPNNSSVTEMIEKMNNPRERESYDIHCPTAALSHRLEWQGVVSLVNLQSINSGV